MDSKDSKLKTHTQKNTGADAVKDELNEFRVVLIGKIGMGKSALGNSLLKTTKFKSCNSPNAVTQIVDTQQCKITVSGKTITFKVCDTPGMFDSSRSTSEIMTQILECMTHSHPGPHVFLFVIKLDRISQESMNTIELFKDHFGDDVLKYTITIFTGKDHIDEPLDDWLNQVKNPKFKTFIDNCNKRYESIDNKGSEDDKTQDIDRILRLIHNTIMENNGDVYTNDMCNKAKDFYQKKYEEDEKEKEAKLRIKIESELRDIIESELRDKIESEIRNKIKEESEAEKTSKQSGLQSTHLQSDNEYESGDNDTDGEEMRQNILPGTRGRVRGPMNEPDINIFQKKIPELLNKLKEPDLLLTSLSARSVFDDDDKEKVEKETREKGKKAGMTTLLQTLLDCGPDAFQLFVECLRENNCIPALQLLDLPLIDAKGGKAENKKKKEKKIEKKIEKKTEKKNKEEKTKKKEEENKTEEKDKEYDILDNVRVGEQVRENILPGFEGEYSPNKGLTSRQPLEAITKTQSGNKYSSLHKCILNHHNEPESNLLIQIQGLIQDGVDINCKDTSDCTILMKACEVGLTSVINLLLDRGADPMLVDKINNTILHYIVKNKHDDIIPCIERIIKTGININSQNKYPKESPIMMACEKGLTSVIHYLLDHGADVNLVDYNGNTVLHYIVKNEHDDIIPCIERIIKRGININRKNSGNQTPIMRACEAGRASVITYLLDHGADVWWFDNIKNTVLHYIVKNKYDDIIPCIERIIQTGINNVQNKFNQTPIMIACEKGLAQVITCLLECGADVSHIDSDGNTVLHYIAQNKYDDIIPCIERIINSGIIDINIQNTYKVTPIMKARLAGLPSVIQCLLAHGANVNSDSTLYS